jgi:hypothetical protein
MTKCTRILARLALVAALPLPAMAQSPDFATPQDALEALMAAVEAGSREALIAVLGPDAADIVRDDDEPDRAEDWQTVIDAYQEGYRFVPAGPGRVEVELGSDDWPFPLAIMRGDGGWRFDAESGRDEIVARQIGLNELDTIDVLEAYVEIQSAFRMVDHDGNGVMEFAAHLISSDDRRDGLYWPGGDSPVGDIAARASLDGYLTEDGENVADPFQGYLFRVLNGQGPDAPGGEMSYVVNDNMVAGHALLAVPADYGVTGVMTFLVGENGRIYEADLGENSLTVAAETEVYNPGDGWTELTAE